jgi:uncharacterized membrane protein
MYSYSFVQWLLFFYIYCFWGWVWESCYVSVMQRKWVNRGFLNGPFMPIYGFGAITILLATIPVKDNLVLVFIFGLIGATILEYFTGLIMVKLFRVKYWDYSNEPFNLNGHICLLCSLVWGGFSILMVKVFHQPIEHIILLIPITLSEVLFFVLTIIIAVDITESIRKAMGLKEILMNLTENNTEIKRIEKRLDAVVAIIGNDIKALKEKTQENRKMFEVRMAEEKKKYEGILEERKEKAAEKKRSRREIFEANLEILRQKKSTTLSLLLHNVNSYIEELRYSAFANSVHKKIEFRKIYKELEKYKEKLMKQEVHLIKHTKKEYIHSIRLLRRNPSAVSDEYAEALEEVKDLDRDN